jgi:hypothetical protein
MSRPLLIFKNSPIPYFTASKWRAVVNSWTDADTVWVERDTGCRESQLIELRVTGYNWKGWNADERFTETGKMLTGKANLLAPVGSVVRIETLPDTEKYGRWLSPTLISLSPLVTQGLVGPADKMENCVQTLDGIVYLDMATYMVDNLPGSHWQTY